MVSPFNSMEILGFVIANGTRNSTEVPVVIVEHDRRYLEVSDLAVVQKSAS